jgi:hypothetical protein
LEDTTENLATEIRKIARMLKNAALSAEQRNNLISYFDEVIESWNKAESTDEFIAMLHSFMLKYLETGNFDTWMMAFDMLRNFKYESMNLKGVLTSINTNKSINIDLTEPDNFKWFIENHSGIAYPADVFQTSSVCK